MIADKLGVSKALISKALSNDPAVNDMTRELIWKTSEELGYRIKSSKKKMMSGVTGNLAVLMPRAYLDDPEYWGKIIKGIDREMADHNYSMLLSSIDVSMRVNEGMPTSITENKVDGAIVLGQLPKDYTDQLKKRNIPFVLVDPSEQDPDTDLVLANNYQGAYQAAQLLLRQGHRNLAFVGDADTTWSFSERYRGFKAAVQSFNGNGNGNEEASFAVIEGMGVSGNGMYTKPEYKADLKRHCQSDNPVTAIFCANDLIAMDSMAFFQEWGISCPGQISVVGFDDLTLAELKEPKLTTISVPKEEIGAKATQLILERLHTPDKLPELVMISTTLVQRNSTAPMKSRVETA
ncbi:LacI family DNA-binding transcriptional regulator [Paenibacillus protaetiae]|nr:LacI family DNA-binding transcriptional regulator [Paenibacillus protaetiae]